MKRRAAFVFWADVLLVVLLFAVLGAIDEYSRKETVLVLNEDDCDYDRFAYNPKVKEIMFVGNDTVLVCEKNSDWSAAVKRAAVVLFVMLSVGLLVYLFERRD